MRKAIAVYCASSCNIDKKYFEAASQLGALLAEKNITCINGAGNQGLMAAVTDAVLQNGGHVKGIIPQFMVDAGWKHPALSETIVTQTMHERKNRMAELSDAVIALPGGVGTLEELMEIITWKQLGLYPYPIILLNLDGYYTPLLEMFDKMIDEKFMHAEYRKTWKVVETPEEAVAVVDQIEEWHADFNKYKQKNP